MTFKECIANDINSVFINTDEFADRVKLDMGAGAKEISIVLDSEQLTHNANIQELNQGTGDIFFYVSKAAFVEAFGRIPRDGDALKFNKVPCTVESVKDTNGVLSITLSYNVG